MTIAGGGGEEEKVRLGKFRKNASTRPTCDRRFRVCHRVYPRTTGRDLHWAGEQPRLSHTRWPIVLSPLLALHVRLILPNLTHGALTEQRFAGVLLRPQVHGRFAPALSMAVTFVTLTASAYWLSFDPLSRRLVTVPTENAWSSRHLLSAAQTRWHRSRLSFPCDQVGG